ncbi:MAG: response regulator transcription factor [Dehalococcoidales bacterium]|nr:response regulator transcription factor [Dehalococcoidales bacterium]
MNTENIKLIVAATESLFLEALVVLIHKRKGLRVIGTAQDGEGVIKLCKNQHPSVLLLEGTMPNTDIVTVVKEIKKLSVGTAVLVIMKHGHPQMVNSFIEAGINGLVTSNISSSELVDVIRLIHTGHIVLNAQGQNMSEVSDNTKLTNSLHPREKEVLRLASGGMSNKRIAVTLSISERTVATHFFNIYRKLGVRTRLEAAVIAIKEGLYNTNELAADIIPNGN